MEYAGGTMIHLWPGNGLGSQSNNLIIVMEETGMDGWTVAQFLSTLFLSLRVIVSLTLDNTVAFFLVDKCQI